MAVTVVLDTNIVLYHLGDALAESLPDGPYAVSIISEMELLSYPSLTTDEERRIRELLARVDVVELSANVRAAAIQIRRVHRLKLPDAIIAGTALAHDLELLTNDRRMSHLPELRVRFMAVKEP